MVILASIFNIGIEDFYFYLRYAWADVMPLGKLAVNYSGSLTKKGLPSLLHKLIAALRTQVNYHSSYNGVYILVVLLV